MRNDTDITDQKLRSLLKKSDFNAPPSPWFTRKVMNRLPARKARVAAWIEYAVYLVAAVLIVGFGIAYGVTTFRSGTVRIMDIIVIATYLCSFCAIIYLMLYPWLTGSEIE